MGGFEDICGRFGVLVLLKGLFFCYHIGYMLGYEVSIHEILPFHVFISICNQKKEKKRKK